MQVVRMNTHTDSDTSVERERERQRRLAVFERGFHMFEDALDRAEAHVSDEAARMSAKELLELAYADRIGGGSSS